MAVRPHRRLVRPAALVLALVAGMAVAVSIGLGQNQESVHDPNKVPPFPDAGFTEEQRQERIEGLRARNADWVQDFVARGRDPRSLPVETGESYSPGVTSLSAAREKSRLAIEGRVIATTYSQDRTTHNLTSIATVEVLRESIGTQVPARIEVVQIGGPAWTEDGVGVLQQFEGDPLLLPDDHVVLLLVPACADVHRMAGRYQTVFGGGIYHVTSGGIRAAEGNAFADTVGGLGADVLLAMFPQDPAQTDNPLCYGP